MDGKPYPEGAVKIHFLPVLSIPGNKDTLIHLVECMLINLDELENLNRTEIGSLKELITKNQIRIRRPYGHNNETYPTGILYGISQYQPISERYHRIKAFPLF